LLSAESAKDSLILYHGAVIGLHAFKLWKLLLEQSSEIMLAYIFRCFMFLALAIFGLGIVS
jgi:hypothetical protein